MIYINHRPRFIIIFLLLPLNFKTLQSLFDGNVLIEYALSKPQIQKRADYADRQQKDENIR